MLWWLILCANLTGLRDAQVVGFELVDWVHLTLHQCWGALPSNQLRAQLEQKGRGRANAISLLEPRHTFYCAIELWGCWFSRLGLGLNYTTGLLDSLACGLQVPGLLAIFVWAHSNNESLLLFPSLPFPSLPFPPLPSLCRGNQTYQVEGECRE